MIDNISIRANARDHLEHRLFGTIWINLILVSVIGGIIAGLPSSIGSAISRTNPALIASIGLLFTIASVALSGPIAYGTSRIFIKVVQGNKKVDFNDLFIGFKESFIESILLNLLRGVFIFLWALLLIVPGIIKAYSYSMASYIQQEAEDKTWRSCIDRSKELTDGYKKQLFFLDLSFIGWYIVGLLCLGIGVLWAAAYHSVARAEFYEKLKKEKGVDYTRESSDESFRVNEDVFFSEEPKEEPAPFAELQEEEKEPFGEAEESPEEPSAEAEEEAADDSEKE